MNKDAWMKLATGISSMASAIALAWLCWMSNTVVAHGQGIVALEVRCQTLEKTDDQVKELLKEMRDDIKKLLERK